MGGAVLITFREVLEAALIIGIILGYLAKVGENRLARYVWWGTGLALLASAVTGYLFEVLAGGFEGRSEEIFEGVVMLVAVGILTSMILWMQRQSRTIKGEIQARVDQAIGGNTVASIAIFAFVSVFREGAETMLFLKAALVSGTQQGVFVGGLAGILGAVLIAWLVFKNAIRLDIRKFFVVTGTLLLLVAAGLFAHGIHELQEAAVLPTIIEHVWDINFILDEKGLIGSFLKALFGYDGNPSLLEVLAWISYLAFFGTKYVLAVGQPRN
ncbi:MAG: FTR1 family protein [Bacillota bacterium]